MFALQGTIESGTSPIDYSWYDSNDSIVSYDLTLCLNATPDVAGTYTFYAENGCGWTSCTSALTVDSIPAVSCSGDQEVCDGTDVCFTGTTIPGNGITYEWTDSDGNVVSYDSTLCLTASALTAGAYTFEAYNECFNNFCTCNLTVDEAPLVSCTGNQETCDGNEVCFSGNYFVRH